MGSRFVSPILVGRDDELDVAIEAAERVAAGRSSHLLVSGEAGVGKTRFAQAVAEAAVGRGFYHLRGGSVRLGSSELPYAPIAEALRAMARDLDAAALAAVLADDGAILARIVPALGPPETVPMDEPAPGSARRRLLQALLEVLVRLAARSPVLFEVEDLHWADSASLATLSFILRSLHEERIGLLLTFRSDELHRRHPLLPWLGEVERLRTVERLELRRLSEAETRQLLAAIRGIEPRPDVVARIQAHSDGNPFLVEELLTVDADRRTWGGSSELPPSLRDVLRARIVPLPDGARALLGVAAVAGRQVDPELLASVADLAPAALDGALDATVDGHLLVTVSGDGPDRFEFRHALIQEVVYDELLPGERVRLHRAIAEALERGRGAGGSRGPGSWAELAHHWEGARDETRTMQAAARAAEEAERGYAFGSALAQYRRCLAGWSVVDDPEAATGWDRVELLRRAARAAWLAGGDPGQVTLLREAVAEADRLNDVVRGSVLRGQLGYALWTSGAPAEARAAYRESVATMPPGPPTAERARVLAALASIVMLNGQLHEASGYCEAAIAMAHDLRDPAIESRALNTLACVATGLGRCGEAIRAIDRALELAIESGDADEVGRAYHNIGEILAACGQDDRALELVRVGSERMDAMGMDAVYGVFIRIHGVLIAFDMGRWAEAVALADTVHLDDPDPTSEVYALARTVELAVASGRWDSADEQLARIAELLPRFESEYQQTGPYAAAAAELALWRARPAEALDAVASGLARLERTDDARYRMRLLRLGLRAVADLAEIARARSDVDAAAAARDIAESLYGRTATARDAIGAMDGGIALEMAAELATVAAEGSRLDGRSDPAAWHAAADAWSARGRPYRRAYTLWRAGEASIGVRDRPGAMSALQAAHAIGVDLAARPLLDEITALARRARIPLEPRPTPAMGGSTGPDGDRARAAAEFGLTPREQEVLELLAQGLSDRRIADALFISVNTAGVHVSRILGKLGVSSRTEAAARAYRLGIVPR
jgi:DNA-binding CsgD family transcriptional regulator/tetratricopeptide (TPR) repeat protein